MEKFNTATLKIRDILIYYGVAIAILSLVRLIAGKKAPDVAGGAASLTMGWIVGQLVIEFLEDCCGKDECGEE